MKKQVKDYFFVTVQFMLFMLYVLPNQRRLNFSIILPLKISGIASLLLGIFTTISSIYVLRKSISVYPSPKENAILITNGIYRYIRHPIYTGVFLTMLGYGLFSENLCRILLSFATLILFFFKSSYEEQRLQRYFENYESYKIKTKRFFPFVF